MGQPSSIRVDFSDEETQRLIRVQDVVALMDAKQKGAREVSPSPASMVQ